MNNLHFDWHLHLSRQLLCTRSKLFWTITLPHSAYYGLVFQISLNVQPVFHLMLRYIASFSGLSKKNRLHNQRHSNESEPDCFFVDLKGGAPAAGGKDYRKWRSSLPRDIETDGGKKSCSFFFCCYHLRSCPSHLQNVEYLLLLPNLDHTEASVTPPPPPPCWKMVVRLDSFLPNCVVLQNSQISNQNRR